MIDSIIKVIKHLIVVFNMLVLFHNLVLNFNLNDYISINSPMNDPAIKAEML